VLCTAPAPWSVRGRRRAERRSHIEDQVADELAHGYRPVEIGVRLVMGTVLGAPSDLAETVSVLRQTRYRPASPGLHPMKAGDKILVAIKDLDSLHLPQWQRAELEAQAILRGYVDGPAIGRATTMECQECGFLRPVVDRDFSRMALDLETVLRPAQRRCPKCGSSSVIALVYSEPTRG
jgi:hypothetical protein